MNFDNNIKKYSVVLADSNRDYLRLLTDYLEQTNKFYIEEYAFDGKQAYELTMYKKPDLLILDLIMPKYDSFAVLEELYINGYDSSTKVVLTSAIGIDFVLKKAESFNINYIFLKPFERKIFQKRIIEVMGEEYSKSLPFCNRSIKNAQDIVTTNIKSVGITANIKGYHYLREAILLVHENSDWMRKLTAGPYVQVAINFDSTPLRVERAMRHAIESAWNRGSLSVLEEFFGYTILETKGKPTNGEFIAMLADRLDTEFKYVD